MWDNITWEEYQDLGDHINSEKHSNLAIREGFLEEAL